MEAAPSVDSDANAVVFNLGTSVIRMDLDEPLQKNPVLKMTSWLRMSWMDFRLKWDPEAYGGITNIRLPASKVWVADVEVRPYIRMPSRNHYHEEKIVISGFQCS